MSELDICTVFKLDETITAVYTGHYRPLQVHLSFITELAQELRVYQKKSGISLLSGFCCVL